MKETQKNKDIDISFFTKILLIQLCITAIIIIIMLAFLKNFNIVDLSPEALTCLPESAKIYDSNDTIVTTASGAQNRIFIELSDLPSYVQMAFIAAEDNRFYQHNGIDTKRIFGALWSNIKAGYYKEGGSTISQQLIKNSHLSSDKKLMRKLQEIILSLQLESRYSKNEILEMYLNYIYFGNGSYGIEVAALNYFNKNASNLTLAEAASLAGIIKSPTNYSPFTNYDNFISRRNSVLKKMHNLNMITNDQLNDALTEDVELSSPNSLNDEYGYIIDKALTDASELTNISIDELLNGGYNIYTTIDTVVNSAVNDVISAKNSFIDEKSEIAIVVLDSKNGAILSLVGGRNYTTRFGFNRATMAKRSPGSTIKPLLVYAPAFENKVLTAASVLYDEKKNFGNYSPNNFNNKYYGNVTLRDALIKSLNVPAVETLSLVGIENSKKIMTDMGYVFSESDNSLSLALGGLTNGITPLELASCYQCLANKGEISATHTIRYITSSTGTVIYTQNIKKSSVLSDETVYLINDILTEAANKNGSAFSIVDTPICAKTGTVSYKNLGNSDIWVAAYDSNYTIIVWQGYDRTDQNNHFANNITGSKYPSVIAANIFSKLYSDSIPTEKIEMPTGLVQCKIDNKTLIENGEIYLSTKYTPEKSVKYEYFIKGTEPTIESPYFSPPEACPVKLDLSSSVPIITLTPLNDYTYYHLYCIVNGEYTLIQTFSGEKDKHISYFDYEFNQSDSNQVKYYFIVPEHMYVTCPDGSPLIGNSSQLLSISNLVNNETSTFINLNYKY